MDRTLFVSYAREDRPFARELAAALSARLAEAQVRATGDWELVPGAGYEPQLDRMIRAADALVFILTSESAASPPCLKELTRAAGDGKRIVPLVLRPVPDEKLPAEVLEPQWVFAEGRPIDAIAAEVGDAVMTDFELVAAHTELLTAARLWEAGRGPLLDGRHLKQARELLARLASNPRPYPAATSLQHRYVEDSAAAGRRRRWILAGTAAGTFIILALLALIARQQAQARRAENGLRLAFAAQAEALGAPERLLTSGLRAAEALELYPSAEADAALRKAISLLPERLAVIATGSFEKLAFGPDSRHFAAVERRGMEHPPLLRVWNAANWTLVRNVEDVEAFVFLGPHRIAMLGQSGQLRFLDIFSRRESGPYPSVDGASMLVADRAGRWVAVARQDNQGSAVAIHDPLGRMQGPVFPVPGMVLDMRFDREGARLAVVSNDGFIGVISVAEMSMRSRIIPRARGPIHFVLGSCLVTPEMSWNLDTAGEPCGFEEGIVSVSPDEQFLMIRDPEAKRLRRTEPSWVSMSLPDRVRDLTFAPDDSFFAFGTGRTIHLFHGIGQERARICFDEREEFREAGNSGPIEEFAVSPDGARIVADMQQPDGRGKPTLSVYGTSGFHARAYVGAGSAEFARVALSGEGLAVAGSGHTASLFDPRNGIVLQEQELRDPEAVSDGIDALAFAPGGAILAVEGRERLWRWDPGRTAVERLATATDGVELVLDPDGRFYAEKTAESVVARDPDSGRVLSTIFLPDIHAIAATPDRTLFAAGDRDGNVSLWWRGHRQAPLEKAARGKAVTSLRFSRDGSLLAAAVGDWGGLRGSNTRDGEVVIWHTRSRRVRRVFAHPRTVWDVDFSRDGRYVASVSLDDKVRVWDIRSGRQLAEIPLHARTTSVRFCDDDRAVVAANEIHHWRAEDLLRVARPRLVRN